MGDVIIRIDPRYFRPTEVETLLGDITKAKQKLGWTPQASAQQICHEMDANDLLETKRNVLLKSHCFSK